MTTRLLLSTTDSGYYWVRRTPESEWRICHLDTAERILTFIGSSADCPLPHFTRIWPDAQTYGPLLPPSPDGFTN